MFKSTVKGELITVFSSCGSNPLQLWQVEVKNGHVKRMTDGDISSFVLEIYGCNVSTTYIVAPKGTKGLGINLPYMVMLVKNMNKPFTFEVTIIDGNGVRRRIRVSTFQSKTQIQPLSASMPIALHAGWNKVQVNLAEYTSRSFHTQFAEVANVKVNANIRLRRIYFCESLLSEDELPHDYRLYKPAPTVIKKVRTKEEDKENKKKPPVDITANEIKGSKMNIKLESKTLISKIDKVEGTPAAAASTESEVKVKVDPQAAANEQNTSPEVDTVIEQAAEEAETSIKEEESALKGELPVTEEEIAPEDTKGVSP